LKWLRNAPFIEVLLELKNTSNKELKNTTNKEKTNLKNECVWEWK